MKDLILKKIDNAMHASYFEGRNETRSPEFDKIVFNYKKEINDQIEKLLKYQRDYNCK
jgi:hypothetical protein